MAAPNSAYNGKSLSDITTISEVLHNEANTFGESVETLKSRFYLDDVFPSQTGFIGCCYSGSFADLHHNQNRYGSYVKFAETTPYNGNWKSHILFTDAGLNTKGHATTNEILSRYPNRLRVNASFFSSYYNHTTAYNLQTSVNNGAWLTTGFYGEINQQQSVNGVFQIYAGAVYNDFVKVRASITNEEGTYYSNELSFYALHPIFETVFQKRASVCDTDGITTTVFISENEFQQLGTLTDTSTSSGIFGFKDEEKTIPLDAGFYAEIGGNRSYNVTSSGEFVQAITCYITPPSNQISVYYGGGDGASSCTWYLDFNVTYQTLYYQGNLEIGTIFYNSADLSTLAVSGYYSDKNQYIGIGANGVMTDYGYCSIN